MGGPTYVAGTPRWAVWAAWGCLLCVAPSGVWRTAVGFGVDLGWDRTQLELEQVPGAGTAYVVWLTVASIVAAGASLGLVQTWGERVPGPVPVLGGRRIPTTLVVAVAGAGVLATTYLVVGSITHWSSVSGFAARPTSAQALLMAACYAPAALWPVLLAACLAAFVARRRASPSPSV